jgi:hypothetical protein
MCGKVFLPDDIAEQAGEIIHQLLMVYSECPHCVHHLLDGFVVEFQTPVSQAVFNESNFHAVPNGIQHSSID